MRVLTQKFPTVLGLLILIGVAVGGLAYMRLQRPQVSPGVTPQKVRITNVADNKFTVSWLTQEKTMGMVEYGPVGGKLTSLAYDERDTENAQAQYLTHSVTVVGLQPNTQYAFRILSGSKQTRFDNSGSPYTASTGPTIGETPAARSFYGTLAPNSTASVDGALVYVALPGGVPASTLVKAGGSYVLTLSTVRTTDLKSYVAYDPAATIVSVTVEAGSAQATAAVSTANANPVPLLTLGQDADYRTPGVTPQVAQVSPVEVQPTASPSEITEAIPSPTAASIFNVEPLGTDINVVATGGVVILNPASDNETLYTLRPELRGTGPKSTILSFSLKGAKTQSDTITVLADGTWSWSPTTDLVAGSYTMTLAYVDTSGAEKSVVRPFKLAKGSATTNPAFEASGSGTLASSKPSASTASTAASAVASPRAAYPATDSGVPVTGVITPTLLTGAVGFAIVVLGALLLAL